MKGKLIGFCASLAGALTCWAATGQTIDPTLPQRMTVGAPSGGAPMHRLDAARSGRSSVSFPKSPRVFRRIRISTGLGPGIAAADGGRIVVSHADAQLSELDADAKLLWTLRTGAAGPQTAPIISNDGTRLVVTSAAEVIAVHPNGRVRYRRSLLSRSLARAAPPLPLEDGSVLFAVESTIVHLERDGSLRRRLEAPDVIVAVLALDAGLFAVTEPGGIFELTAVGNFVARGEFGGRVSEVAGGTTAALVVAVVDRTRLVVSDVRRRERLVFSSGVSLTGPMVPAISKNGDLTVLMGDGLLLDLDPSGVERRRLSLGGMISASFSVGVKNALAPILDPTGRIALARSGMDLLVIARDGTIRPAVGAACPDPVSLIPVAAARLALACASGLIWIIADEERQG